MRDDATRVAFKIVDQVLILYVEHHARRQHVVPMLHQPILGAPEPAKLAEVMGVWLADGKQCGKT